ncbi:MAG: DUF3592 domain-containing protein [Nocardiopsaceae bacterium]|nr:DUF3592 domain-containing protein [Nocardiopsaceae bacterium]
MAYHPPPYKVPHRGTSRVGSVVGAVICGVLTLVLLAVGGIFFLLSRADYSDHTGRAEAVVTEVVMTDDGSIGSDRDEAGDTDVYVDYEAEGQSYSRVKLNGLNPSSYSTGEALTVAYDPADPGDPVTVESTEPGAFDVFGYVGIGLLAGAAVAAVAVIVFVVRIVRR